ncbi:hypothetical protein F53441_11042 [Fusarium austroafricanum]|uniref:Xylanolytic transcriptional activator regulatory domain-containing protein n=1 Tax=Fusarium austroafricanum TaxID=2364996 RepID=A0A8H4K9B6_9HYPO|nr:hypothetical protein F53441_11042 [Fusarium austroafricanum]
MTYPGEPSISVDQSHAADKSRVVPAAAVLQQTIQGPWKNCMSDLTDHELEPHAAAAGSELEPPPKRRRASPEATEGEIYAATPQPCKVQLGTSSNGSGSTQPAVIDVEDYPTHRNEDCPNWAKLQQLEKRTKDDEPWKARDMRKDQTIQALQSKKHSQEAEIKALKTENKSLKAQLAGSRASKDQMDENKALEANTIEEREAAIALNPEGKGDSRIFQHFLALFFLCNHSVANFSRDLVGVDVSKLVGNGPSTEKSSKCGASGCGGSRVQGRRLAGRLSNCFREGGHRRGIVNIGHLDGDERAILHPDKFQQEYESFWNSPQETSAKWVAILLALLSLTAGIYEISGQAKTSQVTIPSSKALAKKAEQCLLLSNYTASSEHAVEALLLLHVGCWLRTKVSDTNLWFLMGKVVQLAICKGHHRDATKVPGSKISPFDAEMRRRVWMGVPSMIPSDCCDTELPRNLNQSDFYPGIPELPPSRPFTENTAILYSIVKASVMTMFKKVVKHTRSLTPTSHDDTVSLDAKIRMAYHNIPEHYKYKPLTSFIVDDVGIITSRATIDFLYLKSIIVLHRQYLTHPQDDRSESSRKACLEAAETVLERQVELHQVTQPGGLLHDMKWMITSLTLSDFTLAAMVICLDMTVGMRQAAGVAGQNDNEGFQKRLAAIRRAHHIWASSSETSEARTVAQALESTIHRANEHMNTWQSSVCNTSTTIYPAADSADQITDFDMIDSIDWSLLDNQIQDPTIQDFDLDLWLMETVGPLGL